jgi:hypothetical protein
VDFWGLWCRIAAEVCCNGYAVVMGDVVVWQGWGGGECGNSAEVGVDWC